MAINVVRVASKSRTLVFMLFPIGQALLRPCGSSFSMHFLGTMASLVSNSVAAGPLDPSGKAFFNRSGYPAVRLWSITSDTSCLLASRDWNTWNNSSAWGFVLRKWISSISSTSAFDIYCGNEEFSSPNGCTNHL